MQINEGKSKLGDRVTQQMSARRAEKHASQTGQKHVRGQKKPSAVVEERLGDQQAKEGKSRLGDRRNPAVSMLHRAQESKVLIQ